MRRVPPEICAVPAPRALTPDQKARPMKLCYFDDFKLGIIKGADQVVDVTAVVKDIPHVGPHDLINGVIAGFAGYKGKLEQAAASGKAIPLANGELPPAVS